MTEHNLTAEIAQIVALAREAIAAVGGSHSHWRQGGIGGVCQTCKSANERQEELRRRLDAITCPPASPEVRGAE